MLQILLEKLTGLQLVKKFPAFHATRRFITALTSVRHLSLSWASPIQSIYPHPTSYVHPNIIHPCMPRFPQWSLSLRFPHQDPIHPPLSPIRATYPAHLILLDFITHTILVKVKVKQSHYRPGQAQSALWKLRFPDFVTTAQDGGRLSALHRPSLPPGNTPVTHFC